MFNTVLQSALEDDSRMWRERGMGISSRDKQAGCLSNLRFADDMLLLSASLSQLKKMMSDCRRSTEKVGLKIHPERRK